MGLLNKRYFFILSFLALSIHSKSQSQFSWGPLGGINFSFLIGDDNYNYSDMNIAYQFGLMINSPINSTYSINPALIYSIKGGSDTKDNSKINLSYLEIPINLKIKYKHGLHLFVGPYAGFLLGAKEIDDDHSYEISDHFKDYDLGLNFGFMYETKKNLGYEIKFGMGLSNINSSSHSISNASIGLSVHYLFFKEAKIK